MADDSSAASETIQLHLVQPYKIEVREHRTVRRYLDRGYRVLHLQRVTDREVLVTMTSAPAESAPA